MTNARPAFKDYQSKLTSVFERIASSQEAQILQAGEWVAETILRDSLIYTLGSGHSLLIAAELYYRAGGLANFDVIHDKTFGRAERLPGYAKVLLDTYPISSDDLLILVSNSGRNELAVEMAVEAKGRGIRTIAITSLSHSLSVAPRATLAKRLFEIADLVIDNCGELGDASIPLAVAGGEVRVGPTSTAAGVLIANSIAIAATESMIARNRQPPVFMSANVDGGDSRNAHLTDFLRNRVRGL